MGLKGYRLNAWFNLNQPAEPHHVDVVHLAELAPLADELAAVLASLDVAL
jgi:hypothetical protein